MPLSAKGSEILSVSFANWIEEERAEPEHADDAITERLAEDFVAPEKSKRKYDENGFLHVPDTNISKACVNPYRGAEIPNSEALGLDPNRVYYLFRDPKELALAAPTFNNLPLMTRHVTQSSATPRPELRVGSTGTNTQFEHPYLKTDLVIWDDEPIAGVEGGQKRELSSSYRYRADMVPGEHEGARYDGTMRDIRGNHVALVEAGRAGSDVVVGDEGDFIMPVKPRQSPKAVLALGAITGFVAPRLAADERFDATAITAILKDTTGKNWLQRKPRLATALLTGPTKYAADVKPEEIHAMLDSLDPLALDEDLTDRTGLDEAETEEEEKERKDRRADDRKAGRDCAADEESETEEEKKDRMEARDRKSKRANDAKSKLGRDETDEEKDKREAEDRANDRKAWDARRGAAHDAKKGSPGMDKAAMDAAIATAVRDAEKRAEDRTIARLRGITEAERAVLPICGPVDVAAFDSAEDIYRFALDKAGVDLTGVPPAAFRTMVGMLPKPGTERTEQRFASDSASLSAGEAFHKKYAGTAA